MTISNHITLADIPHMPVGEIAALPADQLAMLKDAAISNWRKPSLSRIGSMAPFP